MLSALLRLLSVTVSFPSVASPLSVSTAEYGCPLPYLKSSFFSPPFQLVIAMPDLLLPELLDSYKKSLLIIQSFESVLVWSLYLPLLSFSRLLFLLFSFSLRSVGGVHFYHLVIFAHILSPIRTEVVSTLYALSFPRFRTVISRQPLLSN